ncbi:MAG: hypothetical protein KGL39_54340 [Patescibacteria group bacterium]|nr:hypothetical protein [Patescibacteria group bacterium]
MDPKKRASVGGEVTLTKGKRPDGERSAGTTRVGVGLTVNQTVLLTWTGVNVMAPEQGLNGEAAPNHSPRNGVAWGRPTIGPSRPSGAVSSIDPDCFDCFGCFDCFNDAGRGGMVREGGTRRPRTRSGCRDGRLPDRQAERRRPPIAGPPPSKACGRGRE